MSVLGVAGLLLIGGPTQGAALTEPNDGRSYHEYNYLYPPAIKKVDGLADPVLHGWATYPWYLEQFCPVFEFAMDSELFGEADIVATFEFYVTEAGSASGAEDDGVELRYSQGNGEVEYGDRNGSLIGTVDPVTTGWRSVDVSGAVQAAADGDWPWLCLTLYPDYAGGDEHIYVASSENTGYEPYVQIAPEPGSAMLLLGAGGLVLLRRRR